MNNSHKIINDPIYGFITLPYGVLYDIVEHRYFQRLRRIKQLGLTHFVYPGAVNTRFHHALGAFHLSRQTIHALRNKDVIISDEEALGLQIAILLHDIGHGPYSHSLEYKIIDHHHEDIGSLLMEIMNEEMDGALTLGIQIFKGTYHRAFFHQLISGQLDMDRMDYLSRDSYFTGVAEGVIGYDRIIKMMNVIDDQLVIEQKGVYSIEKFLLARRIMYWQVYLHKTVLSADKMLQKMVTSYLADSNIPISSPIRSLHEKYSGQNVGSSKEFAEDFASIDDTEINFLMKQLAHGDYGFPSFLARSLLKRKLFTVELSKEKPTEDYISEIRRQVISTGRIDSSYLNRTIFTGKETNSLYNINSEEISILLKDGSVVPFSHITDNPVIQPTSVRYYVAYPKG